jgi:predicted acylesterase/phospholipase RssA/ABC-type phosphate/phosphonate transport system substrate-binding protein
MKFKWRFLFLLLSLPVVLPAASSRHASAARQPKAAPASNNKDKNPKREPVRVGVIYYDDFQQRAEDFRHVISTLTKTSNRFDFRLNVGTYDEVLDWYQRNLIDVAVMTPGPVAELIRKAAYESARLDSLYIGSRGVRPKPGSYLRSKSNVGTEPRFEYHSVALVNENAPPVSVETIKNLYARGEMEFVLVHQLSASGYILPRYALYENGMPLDTPTRNRVHLSYSHDESMRQLVPSRCLDPEIVKNPEYVEDGVYSADKKLKVAFVSDETELPKIAPAFKDDAACKLKQVPIPQLDEQSIPQDIVLLSADFNERLNKASTSSTNAKADIQRQLTELARVDRHLDREFILKPQSNWMASAEKVGKWIERFDPYHQLTSQAYTIEQIITRLNNFDRQYKGRLRLALVLSGGGAKCAYQLGAIAALENELKKNVQRGHPDVDISLVVGTSGGAINALPVALGISQGKNQEKLRKTWQKLSQRDFINPWPSVAYGWGLCVCLIQAVVLMSLALLLNQSASRPGGRFWEAHNWWLPMSLFMILLGLAETAVFWFEWYPFEIIRPLDKDHNWLHLWSLLLPTLYRSAILLSICGLLFLLVGIKLCLSSSRDDGDRQLSLLPASVPPPRTSRIARHIARGRLFYNNLSKPNGSALRLYLIRRRLVFGMFIAALAFCLLQAYAMVATVGSFSETYGVEEAMLKAFQDFLSEGGITRNTDAGEKAAQLEDLSRQIVKHRDLWKRDLVITASRLPDTEDDLKGSHDSPSALIQHDMYFYYDMEKPQLAAHNGEQQGGDRSKGQAGRQSGKQGKKGDKGREAKAAAQEAKAQEAAQEVAPPPSIPPLDKRFISFNKGENDRLLLDVVIGSSSIFPLYPARPLKRVNLGSAGLTTDMNIIDGGFVHNSPIEAALLWDATHIIVIEATPDEEPSKEKNLLSNLMAAFNYLYTQSQTIDARSRGTVEIFTLRPALATGNEDPNSCLLDFSKRLVDAAIHKGYNDAMNVAEPRFRREPGRPLF